MESFHPDALGKIGTLEAKPTKTLAAKGEKEEEQFPAPVFETHVKDARCKEGETALLECAVTPVNDPNLKIGKSSYSATFKVLLHYDHVISRDQSGR